MGDWLHKFLKEAEVSTEKQQQILMAAVELISEKGYDKVSTSEIASRAGVAEGTIFRHYKTKRTLLEAIIMPAIFSFAGPGIVKDFTEKVLNKEYQSFEDFITTLLLDRFQFAKSEAKLIKLLLQELLMQEDMRQEVFKLFSEVGYPSFEKIILHFQNKGEIIDLPPINIFRIILSNAVGYLAPRFIFFPDAEWDDEKEMQIIINSILKILVVE